MKIFPSFPFYDPISRKVASLKNFFKGYTSQKCVTSHLNASFFNFFLINHTKSGHACAFRPTCLSQEAEEGLGRNKNGFSKPSFPQQTFGAVTERRGQVK